MLTYFCVACPEGAYINTYRYASLSSWLPFCLNIYFQVKKCLLLCLYIIWRGTCRDQRSLSPFFTFHHWASPRGQSQLSRLALQKPLPTHWAILPVPLSKHPFFLSSNSASSYLLILNFVRLQSPAFAFVLNWGSGKIRGESQTAAVGNKKLCLHLLGSEKPAVATVAIAQPSCPTPTVILLFSWAQASLHSIRPSPPVTRPKT